jgi:hypothetical protein
MQEDFAGEFSVHALNWPSAMQRGGFASDFVDIGKVSAVRGDVLCVVLCFTTVIRTVAYDDDSTLERYL